MPDENRKLMRTIPLAINSSFGTTLRAPRGVTLASLGLLAALGFMHLSGTPTLAQSDCIYCACTSSGSMPVPPFWWIPGGGTPYAKATIQPGNTCVWYHTASTMALGEGWGVTDTCATMPGDGANVVYEVYVTQPDVPVLSADIIFGVASSNCDIGGVYGATAAGGWTNTTAFQPPHPVNVWGFVCWLTNRLGVVQPQIEFHYISGTNGRTYIDCIRFRQLTVVLPTCPAITNCGFAGGQCSICGTGAIGRTFILLQHTDLTAPSDSWTPIQTNAGGVGSFGFAVDPGAAPSAFFRVLAR